MKHKPIVYEIYDYLKKYCVGFDNKQSSNQIMRHFNIRDNKIFRSYIEDIRYSDVLTKIVCSRAGNNGGYWLATTYNEAKETADELYRRGIKTLETSSKIKKKAMMDKQLRLVFNKESNVIESYSNNIPSRNLKKEFRIGV